MSTLRENIGHVARSESTGANSGGYPLGVSVPRLVPRLVRLDVEVEVEAIVIELNGPIEKAVNRKISRGVRSTDQLGVTLTNILC